ncbi:MAG: rhomboid family intramembrane serine protease [Phycisphaerales bacterium]|nr:rhomboid family intramembrane serine protease [Phycisphaerales bacterium]
MATAANLATRMGLSDRDYLRGSATPAGRVRLGARGLTATTWIILICVGVFVADAFLTPALPAQWIYTGTNYTVPMAQRADESQLVTKAITPTSGGKAVQALGVKVQGGAAGGVIPVGENLYRRILFLQKWLYFSTSTALVSWIPGAGVSGFEVWRFLGFQFCHYNLSHIIFNMLGLFFFGPIVEAYLGSKRFVAFYLLCGIAGAALYLLLNAGGIAVQSLTGGRAVLPGLLLSDPNTPLIGASAGVMGVLIASARLLPNETVLLFFVIPMRLATVAWGIVIISIASIYFNWNNSGGEAAHLGGAIAGFYLIRRPQQLHAIFDFFGRADPTSVVSKVRRRPTSTAEVDRILDKIREHGIGALDDAEKQTLRSASRRSD